MSKHYEIVYKRTFSLRKLGKRPGARELTEKHCELEFSGENFGRYNISARGGKILNYLELVGKAGNCFLVGLFYFMATWRVLIGLFKFVSHFRESDRFN